MHLATEIIGNVTDPGMGARLHRLDHAGGVETVTIPRADLARRRLKALTDRGTPIAVALPRSQRLFDGAILVLAEERAVIVRVEPEALAAAAPGRCRRRPRGRLSRRQPALARRLRRRRPDGRARARRGAAIATASPT